MRARCTAIGLLAVLAAATLASPATTWAQPRMVVEPRLPPLGKEPAVKDLRHFLHSLRARNHASRHAFRALLSRKHRVSTAARDTLTTRDHRRTAFLKAYLAKDGRRHRARIARKSRAYYSYLRSLETHRVRQLVARVSDEIDRLAYS